MKLRYPLRHSLRRISLIGAVVGGLLFSSVNHAWAAIPTPNRMTLLESPLHLQQFLDAVPMTHDCPLELATRVDHLLAHLPEPPMHAQPDRFVTVKGLRFVGNQRYSDRQLYEQAIAPLHLQPPYTGEDVVMIATQISQLYQDNGYINTWTTIPNLPPDEKNRLTIVIVENGIEKIQLSTLHLGDRLDMMLICNALAAVTQPLHLEQLEQTLQQLERNPLIETIRAELVPGNRPAGQILTVELIGTSSE